MKKKFKKIIILMLSALMVVSNINIAYASSKKIIDINKCKIISKIANENLINYANNQFKKHILAASRDPEGFGFKNMNVEEFTLGQPFSIYEYCDNGIRNNEIYYFPVVYNNKIEAVLGVVFINNEYYSTFQKGFAENLENLINEQNSTFRIFSVNNQLKAISTNEEILLSSTNYRILNDKKYSNTIDEFKFESSNETLSNDEILLCDNDLKSNILNNEMQKLNMSKSELLRNNPDAPYEYKTLPIKRVSQEGKDWCWAATAAAVINYKKNKNLVARDIVKYIYGYEKDEGGSWTDMKKAYNHWDLTPYETGTLPYWQVKSTIDSNSPIHIRLRQGEFNHSVILKGYEKYHERTSVYTLIDSNVENVVSMDIKDDRDSMYYVLGGMLFYWNNSILGF